MLFRLLVSVSVALLSPLVIAAPEPKLTFPPLLPSPTGPLGPLISRKFVLYPRTRSLRWKEAKPPANTNAHQVLGNIGNADPPALLWTPHPSAQCAVSNGGNGGALQCCRVTVAGDLPIVVFLAKIYGYNLNPNDVNGLVYVEGGKGNAAPSWLHSPRTAHVMNGDGYVKPYNAELKVDDRRVACFLSTPLLVAVMIHL
ncbi:hypothetical protein CIB48_g1376 [Xylaria polymorpha]|nr:hypothetical protein CIB48_g1376 [Xylaria polymorpha]